MTRKVAFLGATSGMGRALARRLAREGDSLFLLGRDPAQLTRSAADLEAHHPGGDEVRHFSCDLEQPEGFAAALDAADAALDGFDTLVVTAGLFATQEALEANLDLARRLMTVNYVNTVALCELARERLLRRGGGQLVVFSSVAGDRGRKPVIVYGSSKAGLSAYLEGLDHKYQSLGLSVVCVKPGFVKTGMTAGLRPPPFAGEPDGVATDVLRAMNRRRPVIYTPGIWRGVMAIIRCLPRLVMRRVAF